MNEHGEQHELVAQGVGHVHAINPEVVVQADLVRCAACDGPPAIGIAIGRLEDGGQEIGSALLDPAAALSLANSLIAAVGAALSHGNTDQVVAEVLAGADLDQALEALLSGDA